MPKVMIVDDDPTTVRLLSTLLDLQGHQVVPIHRPDTMMAEIRKERPDLVLLDVFLAGRDGKELVAEIRRTEDLKATFVVMTSGMDLSDQCLAAGADAFLLKPYSPDELTTILNNNLRGSESRTADSAP